MSAPAIRQDRYGLPTIESIRAVLAHREAVGRAGRNRLDGFCSFHERDELSYTAWHEKAQRLMREGQKQVRCADCKRYLWPHELGNPLSSE